MKPDRARALLGSILTLAYSGELGAIRAYIGHRNALTDYAEELDYWPKWSGIMSSTFG